MQSLRMTYYPPCPQPELVTGITPHSDATILTFLLQLNGVDGLHIHKDGCWFPVSILPNALVVNVGDILEVQIFLSSLSCVLNMVLFSNTSSNYDSYSKLVPNFRFSSWVLRILVSYQLGIFFFQFDDIFFFSILIPILFLSNLVYKLLQHANDVFFDEVAKNNPRMINTWQMTWIFFILNIQLLLVWVVYFILCFNFNFFFILDF